MIKQMSKEIEADSDWVYIQIKFDQHCIKNHRKQD